MKKKIEKINFDSDIDQPKSMSSDNSKFMWCSICSKPTWHLIINQFECKCHICKNIKK